LRWDTSDFQQVIGIGKIKALQLSTQIEIAKRMIRGERNQDIILDDHKRSGNTYTQKYDLIRLSGYGYYVLIGKIN
jgi:DNA repair protein RadC